GIWVFLEQTENTLQDVSLEVLGKARDLAAKLNTKVTGVLLGHQSKMLAEEAAKRGADHVILVDSPLLADYSTEGYAKVIADLVKTQNPDILLLGATHNGADLAGRLAVRLGSGLMAHVVELEIENETNLMLGSVPGFGGNILAVCKCHKGRPQMATVRPGVFQALPPDESRVGTVEAVSVDIPTETVRVKTVERSVGKGVDITQAERIVVAGVGTGGDLKLPTKLAELIGGSLGVTRPLSDKAIAPRDLTIGSTGYSVRSKFALIMGASGSAFFVSGINNVDTVIAINNDPEALIFDHADYCVVGDLFKIVPLLIEKLESRKAQGA
ncbi:MAG: electron transfer flavoprotein subunit alpha/FixB family protein, partial [Candidatus Bathyarchaeia archaeon]